MNKIPPKKGLSLLLFLIFVCLGCGSQKQAISDDQRSKIATEMQGELETMLDTWYPRAIDKEHGGYLTRFSYDWKQEDPQNKMIVTQSRHLWTLSKVAEINPDKENYSEFEAHGFQFLKEKMWDEKYGGFYELVNRRGEPIFSEDGGMDKTLYGNAFALYGLSAYYGFSENPEALELCQKTFNWLEEHSHDPVYGGYFQPLDRDGTPGTSGYPKDFNSGIHILEALTELYTVWPDQLVKERLEEMFYIVRDTMVTDRGYLNLYFKPDWTHLSYRDSSRTKIIENIGQDHITPGHDIETAFLLLEAAHVLGLEHDEKTMEIAKKLTDHTLETGWDSETGGFYDIGYYFPGNDQITILEETKNWWAQAEGLNTLLIMEDLYPDDSHNYFEKFVKLWEYIQEYLIDSEYGGWYDSGLDQSPERRKALKSQIWKGNYHTVRSLMNCLERLKE